MGMSKGLIMSIVNRCSEIFPKKKHYSVVASAVVVLLSTSAFAFDRSEFETHPANVSSKAVTYQTVSGVDAMSITLDYSMRQ